MPSSDSSSSSAAGGGGARLYDSSPQSSDGCSGTHAPNQRQNMDSQLVPYAAPTVAAPATFDDIRIKCHEAQSIILKLQQATQSQCGIPVAIREEWFEDLKHIGQCFITAQAASTHIERVVNSQRTQLENDLQYATMERDLARSEKTAAAQEVDVLRARLRDAREGSGPRSEEREQEEASPTPPNTSAWVQEQNWGPSPGQQQQASTPSRPLLVAPDRTSGPRSASYAGRSPMYNRQDDNDTYLQRRLTSLAYGTPSRQQGGPNMGGRPNFAQGPGPAMASTPRGPPPQYGGRRDTVSSGGYESFGSGSTLGPSASVSNIGAMASNARPSMAMTPWGGPLSSNNDTTLRAEESRWKNLIFKTFEMVLAWSRENCSEPNPEGLKLLISKYQGLWEYICRATYQGDQVSANGHAIYMLNDGKVRSFFVARLLIQYIVQRMWTTQDWEGLRDDVTPTLQYCRQRLADGRIPPQLRHETLQRQSRAIKSIIGAPDWRKYEHQKITAHTNRLKDIVGPLLSLNVDRKSASGELNHISTAGWDASAQILASEYSFQFVFNDCGSKFSFGSHAALNSDEDPMVLQTRQWRVMCVVTPGMTYRDDSGVSVTPRFLSKAQVLVMP